MTVICTSASISSTRHCATREGPSFPRPLSFPRKAGIHRRGTDWMPALREQDESESIPSCLDMQKAPGYPGAFVFLCLYSLRSCKTMELRAQLAQLGARR